VARSIFASHTPIISGIGHESDWSIADLVADLRASTPTAAAERSVPDIGEIRNRVNFNVQQIQQHGLSRIENGRNGLVYAVGRLDRAMPDFVNHKIRLDDLINRANSNVSHSNGLTKELLRGITQKIAALAPNATIARGYSVLQKSSDGKIISSVGDVMAGEDISITVSDGVIGAKTVDMNKGSEISEDHQLNLL